AALSGPRASQSAGSLAIDLTDAKILVVDDSADNRHLIRLLLTKRGATIELAENGIEGFKAALAGAHDIVIMDIQMPVMDGYAASRKLREHGYLKPILALTAHAMEEVRQKCLAAGCTDHLSKPINPKELLERVHHYLRREPISRDSHF